MHTSWSGFCTVNHGASASNSQLSNMKCPGRDSNLATSEVEGKDSNHYTTQPLICKEKIECWTKCTKTHIILNRDQHSSAQQALGQPLIPKKAKLEPYLNIT